MNELPSGWQYKKLGDCCKIISGSTPSRSKPEYWNGDIPWVTPKDLSDLKTPILQDTPEKITEAGYKSCSTTLIPDGTILFSSRAPIGHIAIAGKPMCTNQGFKSLVPGTSVNSGYLYWCMRFFTRNISVLGTGTTFKEVSKGTVENFQIPLPPLEEQRRIAAILDKADTVRRKREKAIRLTEELLRSLFLDMFGDPVTNPKEWEVVELGKVTDSKLGKMLSESARKGLNPIKYLGNTHVRWRYFILEELPEMDFSNTELKKLDLRYGDLIVCEGGEVGRCAIWRNQLENISFQKALHRIRCQASVLPEYLQEYFVFMAERGGLVSSTSSATIAHLTGVRLKQLPLPLPPLIDQKRFQKIYNIYENLIYKHKRAYRELSNFFNSLLQKAFRGEL